MPKFAVFAALFFGLANIFLFIVPLTPPPEGGEPYIDLPYWTHALAGWVVFGLGALYWLVWVKILPRVLGYKLVRTREVGKDGLTRWTFGKVARD